MQKLKKDHIVLVFIILIIFSVFQYGIQKFTGSPYIRTNLGIGQVLRMQWAMTGQKQPQWGLIILTATV